MNCDHVHKVLDAYLDGELDEATDAQLAQHLASCPGCAGSAGRAQGAAHGDPAIAASCGTGFAAALDPARTGDRRPRVCSEADACRGLVAGGRAGRHRRFARVCARPLGRGAARGRPARAGDRTPCGFARQAGTAGDRRIAGPARREAGGSRENSISRRPCEIFRSTASRSSADAWTNSPERTRQRSSTEFESTTSPCSCTAPATSRTRRRLRRCYAASLSRHGAAAESASSRRYRMSNRGNCSAFAICCVRPTLEGPELGRSEMLMASTCTRSLTLSSKPKLSPQVRPHWLRSTVVSKSPPQTWRLISGFR